MVNVSNRVTAPAARRSTERLGRKAGLGFTPLKV